MPTQLYSFFVRTIQAIYFTSFNHSVFICKFTSNCCSACVHLRSLKFFFEFNKSSSMINLIISLSFLRSFWITQLQQNVLASNYPAKIHMTTKARYIGRWGLNLPRRFSLLLVLAYTIPRGRILYLMKRDKKSKLSHT